MKFSKFEVFRSMNLIQDFHCFDIFENYEFQYTSINDIKGVTNA